MPSLQQPKFIQIACDKYRLFALDEEGVVWKYMEGYQDATQNGWYPRETLRHATTD
jgi:hypothetical protein